MESTNNNLHHLQHPLELQPSSSYGVAATSSTHSWTPIISLNAGNLNQNLQEANSRSRSLTHKNDIGVPSRSLNDSMIQDLGYHQHQQQWTSDAAAESCLNRINIHHDLDSSSSQFSSVAFPKFSEMLNSNTALPSSIEAYHQLPSTSNLYSTSDQNYPNFGATNVPSRENFSQIYPTINISNLNHNQLSLNLDLLTSPGLSHHSQHHHQHLSHNNNLSFSLHHMQQNPTHSSSCNSSTNTSLFTNGSTTETKRPCTLMESKAPQSLTALKKSRSSSESRPSCPPFKVRKEKLGDRIAALQQLVAPFGKTDTASVLMEAIGYIKFLQGQVETLSVPYMKLSQKHTNRSKQEGLVADGEAKQDLRSRGLCLVPLSCMSYIAGDGGTEVWQQRPNFGGPI